MKHLNNCQNREPNALQYWTRITLYILVGTLDVVPGIASLVKVAIRDFIALPKYSHRVMVGIWYRGENDNN